MQSWAAEKLAATGPIQSGVSHPFEITGRQCTLSSSSVLGNFSALSALSNVSEFELLDYKWLIAYPKKLNGSNHTFFECELIPQCLRSAVRHEFLVLG
jgi:hypothetical protein